MQKIARELQKTISRWLNRKKILLIFGPRRCGKTFLSKSLLKEYQSDSSYFNCENLLVSQVFERNDPDEIKKYIGNHPLCVLDEAQVIPNIGKILKLFHDTYPDVQIIATGSSSFDLSNRTGEPLTGRSLSFQMFPISVREFTINKNRFQIQESIELFLRFGMYPEVLITEEESFIIPYLQNLVSQYLYKDILMFEQIKKSDVLIKLLQLLAFQIGSEVSFHELATQLKINTRTVERYIDLLEKSFVIYRLKSFSRNLRKELSKKEKIYFLDLGIRNALINNFNPTSLREDTEGLWENFCIIEMLKNSYSSNKKPFYYFWRTTDKKEVDLLEENDGKLKAFEFKWNDRKFKPPKDFVETYSTDITLITRENCFDYLLEI